MLPLGQCDDGLFSRPDASGGLKGSGTAGTSARSQPGPQPQPFGVSEVGRFCCFQRGSSRIHSPGVPEWIVKERHHNVWLYKLVNKSDFLLN